MPTICLREGGRHDSDRSLDCARGRTLSTRRQIRLRLMLRVVLRSRVRVTATCCVAYNEMRNKMKKIYSQQKGSFGTGGVVSFFASFESTFIWITHFSNHILTSVRLKDQAAHILQTVVFCSFIFYPRSKVSQSHDCKLVQKYCDCFQVGNSQMHVTFLHAHLSVFKQLDTIRFKSQLISF